MSACLFEIDLTKAGVTSKMSQQPDCSKPRQSPESNCADCPQNLDIRQKQPTANAPQPPAGEHPARGAPVSQAGDQSTFVEVAVTSTENSSTTTKHVYHNNSSLDKSLLLASDLGRVSSTKGHVYYKNTSTGTSILVAGDVDHASLKTLLNTHITRP